MRQHTDNTFTVPYRSPGQYIREARKKLGLSQIETARKADISPSTLSRLESGERMQPRNYAELSEVLQIDPKNLRAKKSIKIKTMSEKVKELKTLFPDWKDLIREML